MSLHPTADITIRRADSVGKADALCIGALGIQVFLDTYAPDGIRPALANEALDSLSPHVIADILKREGEFFVLAETNRHLVGFAHVTERRNHELVASSQAAELNRLYVQEPFTGRGVGKRLLNAAEEAALAGGADALWLTAWVGNARALAFYPRMGYQQCGSTVFTFQGESYENKLFSKSISIQGVAA